MSLISASLARVREVMLVPTATDLDVLIDIAAGAKFSLITLSSVALLIEGTLGFPVRVVLRHSAPADFQARIADDLIEAF